MSKIKLSFSLIFSFFLVGILSTAAFATNTDQYGLKPVQQPDLSLKVPFTGKSTDATDTLGRQFDLVLKDGSNVVKQYGPVATTGTNAPGSGVFIVPAGDIVPNNVYTVELYHTDDIAHVTLLSSSSVLVKDSHNGNMYQLPDSHVDVNGSDLKNANQTGFNNTRKNRTGQKVHGFYQNNTNSCASCHQTHTGADDNLLFKDGVYSTCSACHDGTTGAYNSFAAVNDKTPTSIAGTFDVLKDGHNGSLHLADGSLKVGSAPGGNNNSPDTNKQWGQEFDCASCHGAHGSGSAAENNLNLDPLGWGSVEYVKGSTDKDVLNGKLFKDLIIQASIPSDYDTPYILVKTTAVTQTEIDGNFFWKRGGVTSGTGVIQTYRWNGTKYVADYSLWLQEKGYPYKADTILYGAKVGTVDTDITRVADMTVVWRDGFAYGSQVANVTRATISVGVDVETTDDMASLFDSNNPKYIKDSGTQMSLYCSACHTDYLSSTRTNKTGLYSLAHRHQTATDSLTCVRCHFGHGTVAQIMKNANDQTYYDLTKYSGMASDEAISYLLDPNPSSALKRYTGMSVCYACHGQGVQFLGNQNNVDKPVSGLPGTVRPTTYSVKMTAPASIDTHAQIQGTPTDADFAGFQTISLQAVLKSGPPYSGNVRIVAPNVTGIQLWVKDTAGNYSDLNKTGWDPSTGFKLDASNLTLYPVVTTAGTVIVPIKIVDVTNGNVAVSDSNTIIAK